MSNVTLEQAKVLKELGYPQHEPHERTMYVGSDESLYAPSAEGLMEWLASKENFSIEHSFGEWSIEFSVNETRLRGLEGESLVSVLFQAACWVLEGKK